MVSVVSPVQQELWPRSPLAVPPSMQSSSVPTAPFHDEIYSLGSISKRQPGSFSPSFLVCFGRRSYSGLCMYACLLASMYMHVHFLTQIGKFLAEGLIASLINCSPSGVMGTISEGAQHDGKWEGPRWEVRR